MGESESIKININSRATHKGPEKSTTLNRHYVRRPTKILVEEKTEAKIENVAAAEVEISPKISHINITVDDEVVPEKAVEFDSSAINSAINTAKASAVIETPDLPPAANPFQEALDRAKLERVAKKQTPVDISETNSRALKDAEIEKALREVAMQEAPKSKKDKRAEAKAAALKEAERLKAERKQAEQAKKSAKKAKIEQKVTASDIFENDMEEVSLPKPKRHSNIKRVALAFACSAAVVSALGVLVRINMPDVSVKVAAMQTGIEASYPNYIPRDFNMTGVYTDNDDEVILDFAGPDGKSFSISETTSSWDSTALLNNYVKQKFNSNYTTLRESGITIYIDGSNATWVSGGVHYVLTAENGTLTKKQIKNIVTSL